MIRRRSRRLVAGPLGAAPSTRDTVDPIELAANTALFGFGGWTLENALFGPRFSVVFGDAKVPVLPVYAIGGAAILLTKPHLRKIPWILRVPIYTALLSGIEFVGCQVDRKLFGACSWDYSNAGCANALEGCIDLGHGLLWGALGVLVEGIGWIYDRAAQRQDRLRARSGSANHAALAVQSRRPRRQVTLRASRSLARSL